ncbi:hypothetical protein IGI04_021653 [Brassica rapa subsp. trilocularis]|uniref:DYW domain-containing protein n=1 Tax=Brassica rapa subsp. trilocularis TaxID=1813537 RepID=A0ABQ7M1G9_BRACM|nr:hypothetical protein IGI04_021653 [Brassica rapa subsp. trilocularis]
MKAQLLLRRAFCSSVTPSANAKITHPSRTSQIHEARKLFDSCDSNSVSSWNSMVSEHFTNRMPREAQLLFDQIGERNITSWNGLVSGYMNNGEMEEAKKVFDEMPKKNEVLWTMLQDRRNDNASQGRRCGDVSELRKGIRKSTGCSWTEVGDKAHTFAMGDIHQEQEAIVKFLDEWDVLLREDGYNPDCDAEEGERVDSLSGRYHSERLAVAYGLLKLPEGVPLRVLKNLRVCRDCHAAINLISKVKEKDIILRDAKRLHHFKNGECSCKVIAEVQ